MISFNNLGNLGRLANQMFQYASLKGIARNRGYDFAIPPANVFGKRDPMVRESDLNIYDAFGLDKKNKVGLFPNKVLQERMHTFDEELLLIAQIILMYLDSIKPKSILNILKMR